MNHTDKDENGGKEEKNTPQPEQVSKRKEEEEEEGDILGGGSFELLTEEDLARVRTRDASIAEFMTSRTAVVTRHQSEIDEISGMLRSDRKTQSNSALVQKMASLKVVTRSNSLNSSPNKKDKPARPLLSVKPPRLDTKKNAIIASHKTPDFSPLSANALDRAALFMELCSTLHDDNYLPIWYSSWISSKEAGSIRAMTARIFQTLQNLEFERQRSPSYSVRESHAGKNGALNRYADVAPYDHCRVVLSSKNSNYINASYVTSLLDEQRRYIATQGPLPATFGDFWSMVWEQKSTVIVMLSKEEESGRLKCHRYWPDKVGDTKRYYKAKDSMNSYCFKVWYSEEIPMFENSTIIRELIVTRELVVQETDASPFIPESRMVRIVYFSGWNDHDACDPRALISLVDIANEVNSAEMNVSATGEAFPVGPMVIHCSAGIGRTGTFCTADSIFQYLTSSSLTLPPTLGTEAEIERLPPQDLIALTVNNFRKQRAGFVQTSAQFHLLYEIVLLRLGDLHHNGFPVSWKTTATTSSVL